jgi:hypothetical protein
MDPRHSPQCLPSPREPIHVLPEQANQAPDRLDGLVRFSWTIRYSAIHVRLSPFPDGWAAVAPRAFRDELLHLKRLRLIGMRGKGRGAVWFLIDS